MNNFALRPLQRGFTPDVANNLLEQELMGGFARQRVQFVGNVHTVTASVMLETKLKQQYFWAFWRNHTRDAPRPFMWRLRIDDAEVADYQCQFVAGSLQTQERIGISYAVSFSLRLKPNHTGKGFDETIINLWESGDPRKLLNLLEKLVNEDLPDAFGGL